MQYNELSQVLSKEQSLLEKLLFKLEEVRLVSSANNSDWLEMATGELKVAYADVAVVELQRKKALSAAAVAVGASSELSLGELSNLLPPAQRRELMDHRQRLIAIMQRIHEVSIEGRRLLALLADAAESAQAM